MLSARIAALSLIAAVASTAGAGGSTSLDREQLAAKIHQRRAENRQLLAGYTWKERTEIKQGRKKLLHRSFVSAQLAPDGRIEATPIVTAPGKKGRKQAAKAAKGRQRWHDKLDALLARYSFSTETALRDLLTGATVGSGDIVGTTRIRDRDVIEPGDEVALWIDTATNRLQRYKILTHLDSNSVTIEIDFELLESGLFYRAYESVVVPREHLVMKVERFDYTPLDSTGDPS